MPARKQGALTEKNFPLITESLIKGLENLYPLRLPKIKDSDREIWIAVGRRDVIETLRLIRKRQTAA